MYLDLETQENNTNNIISNDTKFKEEANEEYRNSINNNFYNQETTCTSNEKTKKLFDKNSITKKIFRNFMNKFLIKDLNNKLKKSPKKYFKNVVCDLKKETMNSIFNSSIRNILKSLQISDRYKCSKFHNRKLVEKILKNNEIEINYILSLKVKNYFKNNFMNKDAKVKEFLNKNKRKTRKKQLINFESFLHNIKYKYKNRLDEKSLNEYIKKIEKVANEIISDNENEENITEIKSDENNIDKILKTELINNLNQNYSNELNESHINDYDSDSFLINLNNSFESYSDYYFFKNLPEY